jgi:hypothetical protein
LVLSVEEMRQKISKIQEKVLAKDVADEGGDRSIKMNGSTLKKLLDIGAMIPNTIEKIKHISDELDLEVTVKSGIPFGDHEDDDWIVFTYDPISPPRPEWFVEMLGRDYESEAEVVTYFIAPLLEKLGYNYEDIAIEYAFEPMIGAKKDKPKRVDIALFNGPGRNKNDVLMIVEAKTSDKDITSRAIGEVKYYAKDLLPACYIVTNGIKISVYEFNPFKAHDTQILNFNKSDLRDKWKDFYRCVSKKATIKAKLRNTKGS